MPQVTVFNLRTEDRLKDIEEAVTRSLTSMPELAINDWEINVVPVLRPDGFDGDVTRINIDLWERTERTKEALQELAEALVRLRLVVEHPEGQAKATGRYRHLELAGEDR